MSLPPRFTADRLWGRLTEAQDKAVAVKTFSGEAPSATGHTAVGVKGAAWPRPVTQRAPRIRLVAFGAAAAAVIAVAGGVLMVRRDPPRDRQRDTAAVGLAEQVLVADARSDLPLKFADGSMVTFRAGSAGRMRRLNGTGADVVIDRGWLEAHVVHADTTLWLVHAGPYRVRVTGTRFAMGWTSGNLEVSLYEGAVVIDGALLGAGVPLRAGQRLKIASGVVLIEPLAQSTASPAMAPPAVAVGADAVGEVDQSGVPVTAPSEGPRPADAQPPRTARGRLAGRATSDDEWLSLAERGAYGQALSAARRLGWSGLCKRLDAHHLLTLGDVARYSGAHVQARRAFESLVARFPDDRLAADAVFSLGRLAFESRRPDEATRWFRRYVADWPRGALADQAAGRLVECAIRMDDRSAARSAARAYLARAPRGPQAHLAREVLEQAADGPP